MSYSYGGQQQLMSSTGVGILGEMQYSSFESAGVTIIVVAASLSLLCAVAMLGILGTSMWKRRSSPSEHIFIRTHAAAYFTSLVVADAIQAIASIMSAKWVVAGAVDLGPFCNAQGAIKNGGNLAVSFWSLTLAIHAFYVLFLRLKPTDWVLYVTLFGVWFLIGLLVFIGPAAIQKEGQGPYFGISGLWCWITDPYPAPRIMLEYFWFFSSGGISFILYTLTFLRLRGNITIDGGKMKFHRVASSDSWKYQATRNLVDIQMTLVAQGLIWFPVLFTALIVPISICRFIAWSGKPVPFEATIFADSVFSLMGVFDFILFLTTRSLFPRDNVVLFYPNAKVPDEVKKHGVQPYNVQDFISAHGFNGMRQSQAEKGLETIFPRTNASVNRTVRLPRPVSLGEIPPATTLAVPVLAIPEDELLVQNPNRLTTRTVASLYSQDSSTRSPRSASERSVSPQRDRFRNRDTRFTVSTYTNMGDDEEVPPLPSGAGIDLNTGHDHSDDEDDRHLMQPTHTSRQSDDSLYDNTGASARRF